MERPSVKFENLYPNVYRKVSENLKLLDGQLITFDIDAVTQATYMLALNGVSHKFGKAIHRDELVSYWELTNIAQKNGCGPEEALQVALSAWNNDHVYVDSPDMPGISPLFRFLTEAGQPYKFVSSRPKEFLNVTKIFFEKTFPWIDTNNIILGRNEGEHGGDFKARMLNELGAVLHIEDALDEAKTIVDSTKAKVLIVPQPWNESGRFDNSNVKYLGHYYDNKYSWPLIKFLASDEAREFLSSDVAQSY